MKQRVVITGLGAVTPLGNNVPTMWKALVAGRSGVGLITHELKGFDQDDLVMRVGFGAGLTWGAAATSCAIVTLRCARWRAGSCVGCPHWG